MNAPMQFHKFAFQPVRQMTQEEQEIYKYMKFWELPAKTHNGTLWLNIELMSKFDERRN